jgi:hypothetical protein
MRRSVAYGWHACCVMAPRGKVYLLDSVPLSAVDRDESFVEGGIARLV